jgi:zinc transporter
MPDNFFIHAFGLGPNGHGEILKRDEPPDLSQMKDGYAWLHMCAFENSTRDYFENHAALDPIIIDAMLARETRPRALIKDDGALIILRAMNLHEGEDPEDMISIRIWIDSNRIITTRRRDIKAIDDIVEFIQNDDGPVAPGNFLTMITDRLFERMEPFFIDLEDRISKAEELLASGEDDVAEDASMVRKRTAIFTRYVIPQKKVLETLLSCNQPWLTEEHKEHLAESLDRVTRYVEELHELRERSQILNDELNNAHGRRLNDITYIFSVAATVFLPLSFLTGLLGVNVGGIPGIDNSNGFWVFTGLCIAIIIAQVALFKKLKWF